jgi:hypothetical protein
MDGAVEAIEWEGGGQEAGEEAGHKISLVVGLLGEVVALVLDALAEIPFAGDLEEIPAGVAFILSWIGDLGPMALVAQGIAMAIRAIPGLQEIPLVWTAAWNVTWWMDAHPSKITAVIEKGATIAGAVEGGAGGTEGVSKAGETSTAAAVKTTEAAAGAGEAAGAQAITEEQEAGEAAEGAEATRPERERRETTEARTEAGVEAEGGVEAEEGTTEGTEGATKKEIEPEALGLERPLLGEEGERGQLEKKLLESTPTEESGTPTTEEEIPKLRETEAQRKAREAQERGEKLAERMKRILPRRKEGEEDTELDKAA